MGNSHRHNPVRFQPNHCSLMEQVFNVNYCCRCVASPENVTEILALILPN